MPSDVYQARALAYLVRHFGWLYVGAVAADSEYGQSGTVNFLEEMELNGGCVAFHETMSQAYDAQNIKKLGELYNTNK